MRYDRSLSKLYGPRACFTQLHKNIKGEITMEKVT